MVSCVIYNVRKLRFVVEQREIQTAESLPVFHRNCNGLAGKVV